MVAYETRNVVCVCVWGGGRMIIRAFVRAQKVDLVCL